MFVQSKEELINDGKKYITIEAKKLGIETEGKTFKKLQKEIAAKSPQASTRLNKFLKAWQKWAELPDKDCGTFIGVLATIDKDKARKKLT